MLITAASMPHFKSIAAMYRRAIRLAKYIEGQRRRRLCVFRTRSMLSEALKNGTTQEDMHRHLLDVDIYLDQLESQAGHLRALDGDNVIIPVELRRDVRSTKIVLDSLPGLRKSLATAHASHAGHSHASAPSKLFNGPEPSWLRTGKVKRDRG